MFRPLYVVIFKQLVINITKGEHKTQHNVFIFIHCNWVVTLWQWLFYMYTKHEIGYYWI